MHGVNRLAMRHWFAASAQQQTFRFRLIVLKKSDVGGVQAAEGLC